MKCNHCGAEIADDSVFCEICGKKIRKVTTISSNKSRFSKIPLKVFLFIAVGIVVILLLIMLIQPNYNDYGLAGDSAVGDSAVIEECCDSAVVTEVEAVECVAAEAVECDAEEAIDFKL